MKEILEHLLTADVAPTPLESVDAWWRNHRERTPFDLSIERAIAGGFAADRPAYAFASGYQETLRQLAGASRGVKTAFCATEDGGGHPRAIQTTLTPRGEHLLLQGQKTFVTLGTHAEDLLVVARTGERDGRPVLAVARLDARREGVTVEALPELPFVPEIPHASLRLEGVVVQPDEVLEGDGYLRYLKPMRTVEDCHVLAALLSWVVGVGRRSAWPTAVVEDLLVPLMALHSTAQLAPLAPATHVALAGALRQSEAVLLATEPHWSLVESTTAERWQRDAPLLKVAATARTRRAEAAWKQLPPLK